MEDSDQNKLADGDDAGAVPDNVRFQVFVDGLGICAEPSCEERAVHFRTKLAECAHIIPRRVGSHPREDYKMSLEDRSREENLLYLCEKHHKIIDNNSLAELFPAELIRDWKQKHETWAKNVTKNSAYLPQDLKEKLAMFGEMVSTETSAGKRGIGELLDICFKLLNQNQTEEAKILLAQLEPFVFRENDSELEYLAKLCCARIAWKRHRIPEAKELLFALIDGHPARSEAMADYLDLCNGSPEPDDDEGRVETLFRELDGDCDRMKLIDLCRAHKAGEALVKEDLPDKWSDDVLLNGRFLCQYSLIFDSDGKFERRDQLVDSWEECVPRSPRPIVFRALYKTIDTLRDDKSDIDAYSAALVFLKSLTVALGEKDPLLIRDRLLLIFCELRLSFRSSHISGVGIDLDGLISRFVETLDNCYFDESILEILEEVMGYVRFGESTLGLLLEKVGESRVNPTDSLIELIITHAIGIAALENKLGELLTDTNNRELLNLWNAHKAGKLKSIAQILNDHEKVEFRIDFLKAYCSKDPESGVKLCDLLTVSDDAILEVLFFKLLALDELGLGGECTDLLTEIDSSGMSPRAMHEVARIAFKYEKWDRFLIFGQKLLILPSSPCFSAQLCAQLAIASSYLEDDKGAIEYARKALSDVDLLGASNSEVTLSVLIQSLQIKGLHSEACRAFEKFSSEDRSFALSITGAEAYLKLSDSDSGERAGELILEAFCRSSLFDDDLFLAAYMPLLELVNRKTIALNHLEEVADGSFIRIESLPNWFYIGNNGASMGVTEILPDTENYAAVIDERKLAKIEWPAERYSGDGITRSITDILDPLEFLVHRSSEAMQTMAKTGGKPIWAIKMIQDDGELDRESLKKFSEEFFRTNSNFFEYYLSTPLPFALLCQIEGGPMQALGRIHREGRGFVRCNNGTTDIIESQSEAAKAIIEGRSYFIDGLAALMLAETGLLEQVVSACPNVVVSVSVIRLLRQEAKSVESSSSSVGRAAFVGDDFEFRPRDLEAENKYLQKFRSAADLLDSSFATRISKLYPKVDDERDWESRLSKHFVDPLNYALEEGGILLSDDYYLQELFSVSYETKPPDSCSSISLVKALAESGEIAWKDYLRYFGILASYRFHVMPLDVNAMVQAVLLPQAGDLVSVEPKNLELLNLPVVLSEEYGVKQNVMISIVGQFILRVLCDDSISTDAAGEIFSIVIVRSLSKRNRKLLGKVVVRFCSECLDEKVFVSKWTLEKMDQLESQIAKFQVGFDPLVEAVPTLLNVRDSK